MFSTSAPRDLSGDDKRKVRGVREPLLVTRRRVTKSVAALTRSRRALSVDEYVQEATPTSRLSVNGRPAGWHRRSGTTSAGSAHRSRFRRVEPIGEPTGALKRPIQEAALRKAAMANSRSTLPPKLAPPARMPEYGLRLLIHVTIPAPTPIIKLIMTITASQRPRVDAFNNSPLPGDHTIRTVDMSSFNGASACLRAGILNGWSNRHHPVARSSFCAA